MSNSNHVSTSAIPLTESPTQHQHYPIAKHHVPSNVVAVFIARFDRTSGNTIEWQHPEEIDLDGVEYQCICSGLHRVETDTIYFTKQNRFGVSVFRKEDADETERGATMRAVGVLIESYEEQAGHCPYAWVHGRSLALLEPFKQPNIHQTLKDYYTQHRLEHRLPDLDTSAPVPWARAARHGFQPDTLLFDNHLYRNLFEKLGEAAPQPIEPIPYTASLPFLVAQLGPQIFVLWKAALLRKRILFLTEPPMERACGYVYDTFLLGIVTNGFKTEQRFYPKYTVGVNDIADLYGYPHGYVACTSDAIFESKSEIYDLLVTLPRMDGAGHGIFTPPKFHSTDPDIPSRHNAADVIRFRSVVRQLFDKARGMGFGEDMEPQLGDALERQGDLLDAISMATFQMTLWWYRPQPKSSTPSNGITNNNVSSSSWQRIFAGNSSRSYRKKMSHNIPMDPEEQETLLLGNSNALVDEERDAPELNNNEVFDAVVARASNEHGRPSNDTHQYNPPTGVLEQLTGALAGFFHTLSVQILTRLDALLSTNESDQSDTIVLYPKDMVHLGLHPRADATFVILLASTFFEKDVKVATMCNTPCSCCGSSSTSNDGALRI
ncbi:hypothetical protein K492DRAFT_204110 [Lichtheimia hyalospora FSU 10163]|nr:hypothetical protein K492DRAFT_204110 [Lichtheimia hyalospora FSU 10163]